MEKPLNVKELAAMLKVSASCISHEAKRGHLPGVKIGGRWRFHPLAIDRWIEAAMRKVAEGTKKAA